MPAGDTEHLLSHGHYAATNILGGAKKTLPIQGLCSRLKAISHILHGRTRSGNASEYQAIMNSRTQNATVQIEMLKSRNRDAKATILRHLYLALLT
jgi:hypothetical protein